MNSQSDRPLGLAAILRGNDAKSVPLQEFVPGSNQIIRAKDLTEKEELQHAKEQLAELEKALKDQEKNEQAAIAQAREAAYQQGLKDGTTAGEASGKAIAQASMDARLTETESAINHRLEAIECSLQAVFLDWEGRILELAMAISRHIVGEVCEEPGLAAAHVARAALRKLGAETKVMVHVHPQDFTALEREKSLWNRNTKKIELIEDETIERGGVLVETEAGSIDARIPRMTAKVEALLAEALAEKKAKLGH